MPQFGLVNGKPRHPMDAEIASAIQDARCRPAGEPRLFLGVVNEGGELYRYVTLSGMSQERHLRARLRELGLVSEWDPGVLRRLGTI